MEGVLAFVQNLPPGSKARNLLTSRTKTGGWELPIAVTEMTSEETLEFIKLKSAELQVDFPLDPPTIVLVTQVSGGLPLATHGSSVSTKASASTLSWRVRRVPTRPSLSSVSETSGAC